MAEALAPVRTVDPAFDPTNEVFVAQFAAPAGLQPINMRALTPRQRALMVIDGTVTKFLEAYTMEPIEVRRLGQAEQTLASAQDWLDVPAGETVLARHVMLVGRYSHTFHAYAVSLTVPEAIPVDIKAAMQVDGGSVGRILISSQVESRREILWYGKEQVRDLPPEVARVSDGEFLTRGYRIVMGGRPIILIIERFPFRTEAALAFE